MNGKNSKTIMSREFYHGQYSTDGILAYINKYARVIPGIKKKCKENIYINNIKEEAIKEKFDFIESELPKYQNKLVKTTGFIEKYKTKFRIMKIGNKKKYLLVEENYLLLIKEIFANHYLLANENINEPIAIIIPGMKKDEKVLLGLLMPYRLHQANNFLELEDIINTWE